jgi:integrase
MAKRIPPLTAAKISNTRPDPAGIIELRDGAVPGLRLRIHPTGLRVWSLNIRDSTGKGRRFPVGDGIGLAEAREKAAATRLAVKGGADPIAEKRALRARAGDAEEALTFDGLVRNYYNGGPGTNHRTRDDQLRRIRSVFGSRLAKPAQSLSLLEMQQSVDEWPAKGAAAGAVRYINPLLRWAAHRALVGTTIRLEKPTLTEAIKQRFLTVDELRALLPSLTSEDAGSYEEACLLLLLTATRLTEVTGAVWREFDLEAGSWTIPGVRRKDMRSSETRRAVAAIDHVVPLPTQAVTLLKAIRAKREALNDELGPIKDDELVFRGPRGGGLNNWDRALKRLIKTTGVNDWSAHALRRTAATCAGELGAPPHVIGAMLGHKGAGADQLTARYSKATYTTEHAAILQRLADYYGKLTKRR